MADNGVDCKFHVDHENRIKCCEDNVKDLDNRVTQTEMNVAVFDVELRESIKQMSKLPDAINNLTESNIIMHNKLDTNCEQICRLESDVNDIRKDLKQIDNEGKVNTRVHYTENYAKYKVILYIGCAIGGAALTYVISLIF